MDIAIIGLSLKCANIKTLQQYIELLRNSGVSTIQPTEERIIHSKILKKEAFHPYGFLDRVDFFDHEFFNLSKAEANAIDPSHRMILESVCEAVENSGYSLEEKTFQSTGLFTSFPANAYNVLYQSENRGMDFVSGLPSIGGGRIANILNIRGPVMNIDTACSSSLVAVHEAVQYLKRGEIQKAIVAGSHIRFLFSEANSLENDPIMSSDGICRAFDDLASGTAGGEGVAALVLKPLDLAISDNDNVLAVIKGSAINNDGNRSTSVTAPSPVAQKEVILNAYKNGNIPISSVGYIETHGTGTKLGDPIEYKGIKDAFSSQTESYSVRLGTLKPNIGHLDNMAGLFGLIKAVAVLREKEFFPLANFSNTNTFIEEDENIVLQKEGGSWLSDKTRRAGVSSFGLSGTNAHVILEEYLSKEEQYSKANNDNNWFKITAKSKKALKRYIDNIYNFISETTEIENLAYTLNNGRSDYKYRLAVCGDNIDQIKESLLDQKEKCESINATKYTKVALLYLSDDLQNIDNLLSCGAFNAIFQNQKKEIDANQLNSAVSQTLAFQTSLFKYLSEKGFNINQLICNGSVSKASKAIIDGNTTIPSDLSFDEKPELDFERLRLLAKNCNENSTLLVIVGSNGYLMDTIHETLKNEQIPSIDLLKIMSDKNWNSLWSTLYNNGLTFDWNKFYENGIYRKVESPTYPFEKISCWNEIKNPLFFQTLEESKVANPETRIISKNQSEEEIVMDILKEVLQNYDIQLTDDFFELGGNSIVGIQFINRINEIFGIAIIFDDLFNCYEINDIIALVKDEISKKDNKSADNKSANQLVIDIFEASNSQKRMWVESQFDGSFYNVDLTYILKGAIDITIFKETLIELIKKHASLRSSFFVDENGVIQQKIKNVNDININDFFVLESETDASSVELKKEEAKTTRFDLENGPLFKSTLIQSEQEDHKLLFVFHHIIFDGWSVGIFVKDFVTIYQQILSKNYKPESNKSDYLDYLVWLKDSLSPEKIEPYKSYWQNKLKGINSNLQLGNPSPQTDKGARVKHIIEEQLRNKLNDFAGKNRTTLFVVLMASVRTFLYRLAQENFVIGTPISGRVKKEFESTIGLFINTLPIYAEVDNDQSFIDCLSNERASVTKALEYQTYPYDMILNDLKVVNKQSFFDVLVVLQNQDNRSGLLSKGDLPFEILMDTNQAAQLSRFNMTFTFYEAPNAIELELEYKVEVFGSEFIQTIIESYFHSLEQFLELPAKKISEHSMLNDDQYNKIVYEFNDTKVDFPKDKTIVDFFEAQVKKTPNNIAVIFEEQSITYKELDQRSNQLAHYLQSRGVTTESNVPLVMDRSIDMVLGIMAIFKAGGVYVPVSPSYPLERINFIVNDLDAEVVLVQEQYSGILSIETSKIIVIGDQVIDEESMEGLVNKVSPSDLAYIIYTSGTTGVPKGVMIEHLGMLNHLLCMVEEFDLNQTSRLAQTAPSTFDISIWQLLNNLIVGGSIVIYSDDVIKDVSLFLKSVSKDQINILQLVPSYLESLFSFDDGTYLEKVDTLSVTGEAVTKDVLQQWFSHYPGKRVSNAYGPSEASDDVSFYHMTSLPESSSISIGKPIRNIQLYILGDADQLMPIGVIGELCVSGIGVGRGYWKDEKKTKKSFVKDPFNKEEDARMYRTGDLARWLADGNIEYVGRKDDQVKIRGYRIELGEIESVLTQIESVKQAVVFTKADINGNKRLVGYVVVEGEFDKHYIQDQLKTKLPDYMVPQLWVTLERIPLTRNGKVDKKALPDPDLSDLSTKKYVAPRNETEEKLVAIWQEVLGVDNIGVADDFFELGGHSLNATRLISIIHKQFDVKLSIVDLFDNTILENLSLLIENTVAFSTYEKVDVLIEESENFTL
jgi:amino acid adenylation domain-containing protein